ncbi:MAG: hypothetical protein FWF10_09705 [Clostridiales bacterium]|nr:hypothetical protein [Clostridiales bacterium]
MKKHLIYVLVFTVLLMGCNGSRKEIPREPKEHIFTDLSDVAILTAAILPQMQGGNCFINNGAFDISISEKLNNGQIIKYWISFYGDDCIWKKTIWQESDINKEHPIKDWWYNGQYYSFSNSQWNSFDYEFSELSYIFYEDILIEAAKALEAECPYKVTRWRYTTSESNTGYEDLYEYAYEHENKNGVDSIEYIVIYAFIQDMRSFKVASISVIYSTGKEISIIRGPSDGWFFESQRQRMNRDLGAASPFAVP